jgi:hypothetical protein
VDEIIFAEADDLETLQTQLRDAVHCHFEDDADRPVLAVKASE